jgi:hypothetical protein
MADPLAKQFSAVPGGGSDYGIIASGVANCCGISPGPIRLQYGYAGSKGFGLRHVEDYPRRMEQLRGMGYGSFSDYCLKVAREFQRVERLENGRFALICRRGAYDLWIVIQYDAAGFWTIVTGLPKAAQEKEVLWRREERTGESEPAPAPTVRASRLATLSLPNYRKTGSNGS